MIHIKLAKGYPHQEQEEIAADSWKIESGILVLENARRMQMGWEQPNDSDRPLTLLVAVANYHRIVIESY